MTFAASTRLTPGRAGRQTCSVIGYEEMLELAHQGAQVMQVRAVELGWVNGVVIEVLSSFEDAPGTLIKEDPLVEQRNKVRGSPTTATVRHDLPPPTVRRAASVTSSTAELASMAMIVQNVGYGEARDLSVISSMVNN